MGCSADRPHLLYDLLERRVGHGGAIGEHDGRHRAVSTVDRFNQEGRFFVALDIDFGVVDAVARELGLESLAVAAPHGGVHDERRHGISDQVCPPVVGGYHHGSGRAVSARCEDAGVTPDEILAGLDPEQRAAAEALHGPVVILAGAGTGKTRAITHRIAYGVATGEHDPDRSLAVTFTTRAAGEMRGRLGQLGAPVPARTFHGAALAQLQHFWGKAVGGAPPQILTSKVPQVAKVAAGLGIATDSAMVRDLASEIEWSKSRDVHADSYVQAAALAVRRPPVAAEQVAAVIAGYDRALSAEGLMDFEDVLRLTVGILDDRPDLANTVRDRYRWFTVDEFQDVNPLQMRLLRLWLGDRDDLCVVGDASQTIYTFAGATPEHLLNFREHWPQATEVRLVRSYRCSPQVVELANRVIAGASATPTAAARLMLQSENPDGPVPAVNEYASEAAEAAAVAADVDALIRSGIPPREIAVLYRINAQSEPFEEALGERGIATVLHGSERYFERPEVRKAITLIRGAALADDGPGNLDARVTAVLSAMGYTPERPSGRGAVVEAWSNVSRLVTAAVDLQVASPEATLSDLVAELDRRSSVEHAPDAEAVMLATIHAAKGLEWDAVFIVGLVEGSLPLVHAVTPEEIEEERRLLYVAVTRARRHLTLTWARSRQAGWSERARSRFLDELPVKAGSASTPLVIPGGQPRGERRRAAPARCRSCGKSLVTANERTIGRCRACPSDLDDDLFDRLKSWRLEQAKTRSVPAFVIFTDATLMALAEQRPESPEALLQISGIGRAKLDEHGEVLLAIIAGRSPDEVAE